MRRRWVVPFLRILVAAVFLFAAYTKLRQSWLIFAMSIDAYGLLPPWAVMGVARTLPWAELAIGVLLLAGWGLRYAAAAATALLVTFFGVMLWAYAQGRGIDCGCFGIGEVITGATLMRDGLLLVCSAALTLAMFQRRRTIRAI